MAKEKIGLLHAHKNVGLPSLKNKMYIIFAASSHLLILYLGFSSCTFNLTTISYEHIVLKGYMCLAI